MKRHFVAVLVWFATCGVAAAAVNINTATKEELMTVKGIAEKRAHDIIDYRTKNGPFRNIDDLQKVPGISPELMQQIRSNVTVAGKTVIEKRPATAAKRRSSRSTKIVKAPQAKTPTPAKRAATKTASRGVKLTAEKSKSNEKVKNERKLEQKWKTDKK